VPLLALAVRQPADEEQVVTLEQANAIAEIEPNAAVEFVCDVGQAGGAKAGLHAAQWSD
jgi:hypothetical protein